MDTLWTPPPARKEVHSFDARNSDEHSVYLEDYAVGQFPELSYLTEPEYIGPARCYPFVLLGGEWILRISALLITRWGKGTELIQLRSPLIGEQLGQLAPQFLAISQQSCPFYHVVGDVIHSVAVRRCAPHQKIQTLDALLCCLLTHHDDMRTGVVA